MIDIDSKHPSVHDDSDHNHDTLSIFSNRWSRKLLSWGVESRGIVPVPVAERTDTKFSKIFFIWYTGNFNILPFSAGTLGPVSFGLSLRDTCLVILFFNLLCCALPAYLTTWGPKLGLRQMVQARYSFGYYGVIVPCIFNLIGMCGFTILNCILGGQTLSSVADGNLSWTVGIVIISVISLLISFCGLNVLNWYEKIAWIPVLIVFIIALSVGGKHLINTPSPSSSSSSSSSSSYSSSSYSTSASASNILTFGSTIASFVITYAGLSSDFTSYFHPGAPSVRLFWYSYAGLLLPIVTLQCLGAAVAVAASSVPSWEAGYANGNVGGLLGAMLSPTGNFGKFLTVLLAGSVTGNIAMTFYSISLNIQVFIPSLIVVPRYVFSFLATGIIIPLSIIGSHKFYTTLIDFLGLIGYWAASFASIILIEHILFRRNNPQLYDLTLWASPRRLPSGIAALGAGIASLGLIIPCMGQAWYVGPIARRTGDVGFEVAFLVSGILYVPFRALEVWWRGHL